ncbi:MAG: chemotaxis protein CheW [Ruminiclostridium sp.]
MESTKQVIVLKLGNVQYGFPIELVNEIIRYVAPIKIPNAPDYIQGIISLRGKVHAIINLRYLLGIEKKEADENTKIIIANGSNVGFIVDDVNMIVSPKDEEVDAATDLPGYINKNYVLYILKIDGEIIVVLNMVSILDTSREVKKVV